MELPKLTLGIEEEYLLVDPASRELAPEGDEVVEEGEKVLPGQIKPEMMRAQVEVGTRVTNDIAEARSEVVRLRGAVIDLAEKRGLRLMAASTHPWSLWIDQPVTDSHRYHKLNTDLRDVARRLLICGMHVHVGIENPELRIDVLNQARYFVPHVLALSTSSPFWGGRDTGLKSYRSIVFGNMPRSGIPPEFRSWSDWEKFSATLVKTGCIDEPTKIWWDIRPHGSFPTVEFRMADVCTRVDEVICVTALLQALVAKLIKLRLENRAWRVYRHHLITENKWRAVRYGLDGKIIDFGQRREVPVRDLITELQETVDDVVDDLGVRAEVAYLDKILENGTSADRQLATYAETGDLKAVVDRVVAESREGCS